jgi:hypothetical protein
MELLLTNPKKTFVVKCDTSYSHFQWFKPIFPQHMNVFEGNGPITPLEKKQMDLEQNGLPNISPQIPKSIVCQEMINYWLDNDASWDHHVFPNLACDIRKQLLHSPGEHMESIPYYVGMHCGNPPRGNFLWNAPLRKLYGADKVDIKPPESYVARPAYGIGQAGGGGGGPIRCAS